MADDVFDTRRRLKQRGEDIDSKVDSADNAKKKTKAKAPTKRGINADQARRTKHKGTKGEKAFGTPMDTGARERQTTDSNN